MLKEVPTDSGLEQSTPRAELRAELAAHRGDIRARIAELRAARRSGSGTSAGARSQALIEELGELRQARRHRLEEIRAEFRRYYGSGSSSGGGAADPGETGPFEAANADTGAGGPWASPPSAPAAQPAEGSGADTAGAAPDAAPASAPDIASALDGARAADAVQTIIDDMTKLNDLPLIGAPAGPDWSRGPGMVMGADPRGAAAPAYWKPYDTHLLSGAWWHAFLPWFVLWMGEGDAATNTRVEVRDMTVWVQSRSAGTWRLLGRSSVSGEDYPTHLLGDAVGSADASRSANGTLSVRPQRGWAFHGWWNAGKASIDAPDLRNVYVNVEARLVVADARMPDDRAKARYLLQVGADYYPSTSTHLSAFAPTGYNPGVGRGRFKLLTSEWQVFNFTTMPVSEVRSAPPPLD